jgi:zinc transport system substrate-binding protein
MKNMLLPVILFLLCGLPTKPAWSAEMAAPQVVVSIKPVHALVAGVMQGVAEPQLLVKGGGSPHDYALRPSEARALSQAELIVWVGPQLESFLEKPLSTLARNARQLKLSETLQAVMLPSRKAGDWEEHHDEHHHSDHQNHSAVGLNPHLWLDPLLAKQIVTETATTLSELDPQNRTSYRKNAVRLQLRLEELHRQLQAKLAPVKAVPYLVFHDAYQYFEKAYMLNAVGSLTVDPERKPGARRIRQMREKIKVLAARCVFSEPQFEPRLVATIIAGTGARTGVLDPLGAELKPGPESYFQLLNALADDLVNGLR